MGWGRWFGEDILSRKNELMIVIIDGGGGSIDLFINHMRGPRKQKRYFIIEQQVARYFVLSSECLSKFLISYSMQSFLKSRISANHGKEKGFSHS